MAMSYPLVMNELKRALKRQNTSYAELAREMDLPESTLKKWFNAKDGSFDRIISICQVLGLPVYAVIKNAEEQNVQTFTFSETQQKFFLKDKTCFAIYWLLVYERMTADEVMKRLGIDQKVMDRAMLGLDKIKLVQYGPNNSLKIPKMRPIRWKFEGEFMVELLRSWVTEIFKDNLANKKDASMMLQFFQLTPQSEDELRREIALLEEKFARRTILELGNLNLKLRKIRYVSALSEGSFVD